MVTAIIEILLPALNSAVMKSVWKHGQHCCLKLTVPVNVFPHLCEML